MLALASPSRCRGASPRALSALSVGRLALEREEWRWCIGSPLPSCAQQLSTVLTGGTEVQVLAAVRVPEGALSRITQLERRQPGMQQGSVVVQETQSLEGKCRLVKKL